MKIFSTLLAVFLSFSIAAQPKGILKGKIVDKDNGEPIPFANIMIEKVNDSTLGGTSDFDGNYLFSELDTGIWNLKVKYIGYQTKMIKEIQVSTGKVTVINIKLSTGLSLKEVVIIDYKEPLYEMDKTTTKSQVVREEIERMAVRSSSDIAKTAGNGVFSRDNAQVRGSRSTNSVTFIDGIKVIGNTKLPSSSLKKPDLYYNEQNRTAVGNELYQKLVDNPFESPQKAPLSTFSIDVDNASYSNIRRYLNQGSLPPIDAVRIEEMINYFDYNFPQPKDEHPFSITTELSDCPWNSKRQLAMIGIQGKEVDMKNAPNSNLVFLIDVSGSMSSYNKLALLKKGMNLLTDELRENDRIAIVVYAGAAGVVLSATAGNQKKKIKEVLNKLSACGSTAGGAGIQLAYKIAKENYIEGGNNRIILATDGDFNVGTSSQSALTKLIEKKRSTGVFLSVLGFGSGNLQDYKMEQLANKGNGNYYYIDNILEAKKVLVSEMGGTLLTIAKDVKVQAEFNPRKVRAYRLIGYVNRALADEDFNDDRKDAGELGSGHSVTVLYEIIPAGSSEKIMDVDSLKYQQQKTIKNSFSDEILTVKFRYKKPDSDQSTLMTKVIKDKSISLVEASPNIKLSAAIAGFGMKLRRSESTQEYQYQAIADLAKSARSIDENGYRSEFLKMVETAELLDK